MEQSKKILKNIYDSYGTDSGSLFGITEKQVVVAIIEFTLRYVERHKNDEFPTLKNTVNEN